MTSQNFELLFACLWKMFTLWAWMPIFGFLIYMKFENKGIVDSEEGY